MQSAVPGTPLVSVIVATYNRRKELATCLSSIEADTTFPKEIIVIDDASSDGTDVMIQQKFPSCRYLRNEKRSLKAIGLNRAFSEARGEYVLAIDDDNVIDSNLMRQLVADFESDSHVGVVGPIALYRSMPNVVMYAGCKLSSIGRRAVFLYRNMEYSRIRKSHVVVDYVTNCFAVRRSLLSNALPIDAVRFPFTHCEAGIQARIREMGYRIVVDPLAITYHDIEPGDPASRVYSSEFRTYDLIRSKVLFEKYVDRSPGAYVFMLSLPLQFAYHIIRSITVKSQSTPRSRVIRAIALGMADGLADSSHPAIYSQIAA